MLNQGFLLSDKVLGIILANEQLKNVSHKLKWNM